MTEEQIVNIRKIWMPVSLVAAILVTIVPIVSIWATDRSTINNTIEKVNSIVPKVHIIEIRQEVQSEVNSNILILMNGIDKRLERIETRLESQR